MLLLSIKPTEISPCIMLDTDTNIFEISGSSRPENISAFYKPIINIIENYFQLMLQKKSADEQVSFICNFKFNYFNSGTSHFIANLFQLFNMYALYGIVSQIFWYYDEEDMDMYEAGEELSFLTNLTSTRCNYLSSDFIRI